ncbi:hypothetical protein [Burkholderia gladioli]|uniref:AbiTii domain-containing protein n=1 Tax=Burkholderia gladioli TaxID=28095 RepID=UPI00163FD092|nr:hypothetical protein [Burkholderia gladioli]
MVSLVLEMQREAMNPNGSITGLLRMALVVSRKLGIEEFQRWAESELNGYKATDDVPEYRLLRGDPSVWNPYHGWQPLMFQNPKEAETVSKRPTHQPAAQIEEMLQGSDNSTFAMYFPAAAEQRLMNAMAFPRLRPATVVPRSAVAGIADAIRNTILDWSLKLENAGVLGDGLTFSAQEKERAPYAGVHITYQAENQTVIQSMTNSQVQQATTASTQSLIVKEVDVEAVSKLMQSLRQSLDDFTLNSDQRAEIEADITTVSAQAASPKPRFAVIKEAMHSMRSVLENAAGSAVGTAIVAEFARLLS